MKSLVRWSATLGLVSSILVGSLLAGATDVLALTNEQIVERLRPIPVFTITDAEGAPLVASPTEGQEGTLITNIFISQQDAQNFLNDLSVDEPELAQGVRVIPVSLAEVYELAIASGQQPEPLEFLFIPMQQQVESALSLLQQSGEDIEQFQGVPLFVARASDEEGTYLTIQQGEQQVIPMFFKQEEMQAMLDRLEQTQPELASTVSIQVLNLEGLIETLQSSDNEGLNQILLIPPQETVEFIRSLQPAQPGQAQPQPAPTSP